jgi:hypothetical protein
MNTKQKIKAINALSYVRQLQAINKMLKDSPGPYPFSVLSDLFRLEQRAHRITTRQCNGDNTPKDDKELKNIENKVRGLFKPKFAKSFFINGDPRGHALKIKETEARKVGLYLDWGGYGILAPEL